MNDTSPYNPRQPMNKAIKEDTSMSDRLFGLVKFCGQVVQKVIRIDLFRVHVEPGLLQGGQSLPRIFHIDLHSEGVEIFPRGRNEDRIDLRVKGLVMKIFYDTYHGPCPIAIYPEMPPENILGRRKVKLMHHCLVHENCGCPCSFKG